MTAKSADLAEISKARPSLAQRIRRALGAVRRSVSVDTFDVFVRSVTEEDRAFRDPPGYRFAFATAEEIDGCAVRHTELDERERREGIERIRAGHRATVAFHGSTIVFSMWVNPRNLNVPLHVKRRLRPHQAFIYKAFTSPDHRGKGLYEAGMRFVLADLARRGQTELVGYAHVKKAISRKGLAALRFESIGRFTRLSLAGWHRTFVSAKLAAHLPPVEPTTAPASPPAAAGHRP